MIPDGRNNNNGDWVMDTGEGCFLCEYIEIIKTQEGTTYHCKMKPRGKDTIGWDTGVSSYIGKLCEKFNKAKPEHK